MASAPLSNFNQRIRALQLVNHLAVLVGVIAVIAGWCSAWYLLVGFVSYVVIVLLGTTIGLHRYFTHRTFKTNEFWHYLIGFFATICTVGTIIGWVGLHRFHHANTDTEEDPHDPRRIGIWNAWTYNWKRSKISKNTIKLELRDPMIVFMHKHYFKIIFAYIVLLAIINPWLVIWCYCVPACGSYLAISAVTVIGHMHGYVTHPVGDEARNSWITSLLSLGEGWHNNHHAHPGDHRNGHEWWELDPSAWVIEHVISK